jgi:hypothetical protein
MSHIGFNGPECDTCISHYAECVSVGVIAMSLTVRYWIGSRSFTHTGNGAGMTRFLANLNSQRIKWEYATDKPEPVANLFPVLK